MTHKCEGNVPYSGYGVAIEDCIEDNGELWISNGEYASRVNFCPYCGFKAEKQMRFVEEVNQWGSKWNAVELDGSPVKMSV